MLTTLYANSQYSITATEPAGLFNFNELWSFSITRPNTSNTLEYVVKMDLERQGEGLVISANSAQFSINGQFININPGNKNILEPLSMQYYNGFAYATILANNGRLPEGTYNVRFTLFELDGPIKKIIAAETEYTLTIDPMAIIFQTSPMDMDTLCEEMPLLSWVYTNPMSLENNISYKVIIVELANGQNAYDGVMYNPPFWIEDNLNSTFFQYPVTGRQLIPGQNYAWQIIALNNNVATAYSEVWSFNYCFQQQKTEEKLMLDMPYSDLSNTASPVVLIVDNTLRFRVNQRFGAGLLDFKITDINNKIIVSNNDFELKIKDGDNRYLIDLCGKDGFKLNKGKYKLTVTDAKNVEWYLNIDNNPQYTCD